MTHQPHSNLGTLALVKECLFTKIRWSSLMYFIQRKARSKWLLEEYSIQLRRIVHKNLSFGTCLTSFPQLDL